MNGSDLRHVLRLGLRMLVAAFVSFATARAEEATSPENGTKQNAAAAPSEADAVDASLKESDIVDLTKWRITDFAGKGEVRYEEGKAILGMGNDLTGITWKGPLIRRNYDIELDAMRVEGEDFFCGLTFPVGKDPCSFIVGGWHGTVVGLSSLDYNDAYNNETARFVEFEKNRWYHIRVRVTEKKIQAWIDDKRMVNVNTEGRIIGIRWEVEKSVPLGIATWRTTGAIRNVRMRPLDENELRAEAEDQEAEDESWH